MRRTVRRVLAGLIAGLLLLSAAVTGPNTVLCFGPGNHCHLENPMGASCTAPVRSARHAPRDPDGCPAGSRDIRVNVDTHRANSGAAVAAPLTAALLRVIRVVSGARRVHSFHLPARFIPPPAANLRF